MLPRRSTSGCALLNPCYAGTEKEFVALGRPGFERVLEAMEGKVSFAPPSDDFHDHFDYQAGLRFAVAAFAAEDVAGVLAELEARRWSDLRIATSGVGRVADARVVPLLLRAHADKDIQTRVGAVHCLGMQRDPRATEALLRACLIARRMCAWPRSRRSARSEILAPSSH